VEVKIELNKNVNSREEFRKKLEKAEEEIERTNIKNEYDEQMHTNRNSTGFVKQKQNSDEWEKKHRIKEVERNTPRHYTVRKANYEVTIKYINELTRV